MMASGRLVLTCSECGLRILPRTTYWREARVWLKSREGGGANAAYNQTPTGRYLCNVCYDRLSLKGDQLSLWPDDD